MANHLRRQIREAAATAVTGLTTTGARVYQARVYPLQEAEVPGLLVFTNDEASARVGMPRPSLFERHLQLVIEGHAKAVSDLEDTLDAIAKEVEIALSTDAGFLALVKPASLVSTEIDLVGEIEKPVGRVRLTFDCTYYAREDTPDVPG